MEQSALANISRTIVQLHKEFYGRGPTGAKTYIADDVVVVLMSGGFTKVEETLLDRGRGDSVISQRMDFQEVMGGQFRKVIEEEIGREVIAFMSGSHQDPDLLVETFVLEPRDKPDLFDDANAFGDENEALSAWGEQTRRQARALREERRELRDESSRLSEENRSRRGPQSGPA